MGFFYYISLLTISSKIPLQLVSDPTNHLIVGTHRKSEFIVDLEIFDGDDRGIFHVFCEYRIAEWSKDVASHLIAVFGLSNTNRDGHIRDTLLYYRCGHFAQMYEPCRLKVTRCIAGDCILISNVFEQTIECSVVGGVGAESEYEGGAKDRIACGYRLHELFSSDLGRRIEFARIRD